MFGRCIIPFSGHRAQGKVAYHCHSSPECSQRNEYFGRRRKHMINRNENKCCIFDFHYYSSFLFFLQYKAHTNIQLPKYRGEAAKQVPGNEAKMAQNVFSISKSIAVIHCDMQQHLLFLSHVKNNVYREEIVETI